MRAARVAFLLHLVVCAAMAGIRVRYGDRLGNGVRPAPGWVDVGPVSIAANRFGALVVWLDETTGTTESIQWAAVGADGVPRFPFSRTIAYAGALAGGFRIVAATDGDGYLAAWSEHDVWLAAFDRSGEPAAGPREALAGAQIDALVWAGDRYVAAYRRSGELWCASVDRSGRVSGETRIGWVRTGYPAFLASGPSGVALAWRDDSAFIRFAIVRGSGGPVHAPLLLGAIDPAGAPEPKGLVAFAGGWAALWSAAGGEHVRFFDSVFRPDGPVITLPEPLVLTMGIAAGEDVLAVGWQSGQAPQALATKGFRVTRDGVIEPREVLPTAPLRPQDTTRWLYGLADNGFGSLFAAHAESSYQRDRDAVEVSILAPTGWGRTTIVSIEAAAQMGFAAAESEGNFLVAWTEEGADSTEHLYAGPVTRSGGWRGDIDLGPGNVMKAIGGDKRFVVFWSSPAGLAAAFLTRGRAEHIREPVVLFPGQHAVHIDALWTGTDYIVVWVPPGEPYRVLAARLNGDGFPIDPAPIAVTPGPHPAVPPGERPYYADERPAIVRADGALFLIWEAAVHPPRGLAVRDPYIRGQRLTTSLVPIGPPMQVAPPPSRGPALATDGRTVLATWIASGDLRAARYEGARRLDGDFGVLLTAMPPDSPGPQFVPLGPWWVGYDGRLVVWMTRDLQFGGSRLAHPHRRLGRPAIAATSDVAMILFGATIPFWSSAPAGWTAFLDARGTSRGRPVQR